MNNIDKLVFNFRSKRRSYGDFAHFPAAHQTSQFGIDQLGYLDYVTVLVFLIAPSLLGLTEMAGTIAYLLVFIHLARTLVTNFPLKVVKKLPFSIHGWVERVVGPFFVLLPFTFGLNGAAQVFYIAIGNVIILAQSNHSPKLRDEPGFIKKAD